MKTFPPVKFDSVGYVWIYKPDYLHHTKSRNKYVLEHKLVVEHYLRRPLVKGEVVHHVNRDKTDNVISNLMVFTGFGSHSAFENYGHCDPKDIVFDGRNLFRCLV